MQASARLLSLLSVVLTWLSLAAIAAPDDKFERFMQVTGFDVALESIRLSADAAPMIIGVPPDAFGARWPEMVEEVFDADAMQQEALDILEQPIEPELLDHAIDFYATDLGQRLVVAENASHVQEDEALKEESGKAIIAGLVRLGAPRLEDLKRLLAATGSADASVHAIQEIQVRFMMAAASVGVIDLRLDEADLRAAIEQQEGELRRNMQTSGLANAAYTYQAFSDAEVAAYADALEDPRMQRVYALMNAVQFQIMADRFEMLALRMQDLRPSQEL
jgi:hypothetical protein